MNRTYLVLILALVLGLGAISYAAYEYTRPLPIAQVASTTPPLIDETPVIHPFGQVTIAVGEVVRFDGLQIRVLEVVEDSRCPSDVQCIQAGTVRVRVETVSGMGTSTDIIALGKGITTEAEEITFLSATPDALSTKDIDATEYRFTFEVVKRDGVVVAPAPGKCYIGGCSSQLCSDTPDMVSTCEWREAYACYQGARCERQATGACGWTPTPQLTACLNTAQ